MGAFFVRREGLMMMQIMTTGKQRRGGGTVVASCFSLPCWPVLCLSLELSQHKIFFNPSSFCRSVLFFLSLLVSFPCKSRSICRCLSTHRYSSGQYLGNFEISSIISSLSLFKLLCLSLIACLTRILHVGPMLF